MTKPALLLTLTLTCGCATVPPSRTSPPLPASYADLADYRAARERLVAYDRATRLGANLVLTPAEQAANRRLMALKQAELDRTRDFESRSIAIDASIVLDIRTRDPEFDVKFIAAAGRSATREQIAQALANVLDLRASDPHRVIGFDLVQEEDRGNTNLYYAEPLLAAQREAARRGLSLPLYLHSGETNWVENENVYDAILLGASRIGHGLSLIKHPRLMQLVKGRGIAVEVCPISNQILGYTSDLRNHPAVHYINAGLPVVLSTDDPAIFRQSLSHDFYVAFMAWGLDLSSLKQLALNSLEYSAMNAEEKRRAIAAWSRRWTAFISWLNQQPPLPEETPHPGYAQAPPEPRPVVEVAGSFASGLVADKSWAPGVGARVAIAPWSTRRLSLEFDASWTLGSVPQNPKANHGSPTIASAQVGYYFSDARVQPFLGGGIGVVWSSLGHALAAGERPARGTWNLGGGVRIRVVRAISFLPEFRWYAPNPNAIYRLSFVLAYGW